MSKWGGRPHWEFDAVLLGSDDHGDWIGIPAATYMSRPGAEVTTEVDQVSLVPAGGPDADRAWLATFHAVGGPVNTYVDISTPPTWDGRVLRATDLDLDVVREVTGEVWVDDEDEFAEHQILFSYPDEVVDPRDGVVRTDPRSNGGQGEPVRRHCRLLASSRIGTAT